MWVEDASGEANVEYGRPTCAAAMEPQSRPRKMLGSSFIAWRRMLFGLNPSPPDPAGR